MLDIDKILSKDPDELRQFTALLLAEVKSQAVLIEKLRHQLVGHRSHRFGSSSESIEQLQLALETSEIAVAQMTAKLRLPDEEPKDKPKRRPIPDHIPRMEVELTTGDDDCPQCGGGLRRLGEDVTEELEYVPGRFIVNRIVRPRFACSGCEAFTQAVLPSRPIERGRPGPGLLAHVLVNKYADHLPLYRQSGIFERDGIDIDRSTLADWISKSTALLEPLADAIGRHVLAGQAIFADDTPVKMLAPGTGKTATGVPPLGYEVKDRKLIVKEADAANIRWIFDRFIEIGSGTELARELAARGIQTSRGNRIDKKYLYRLLNNRAYIGEAVHKGNSYPGEHDAIIDRAIWDKVHSILTESPRKRAARTRTDTPALLKGLLYGPDGAAFSPTHTRKGGKFYRYYVSQTVLKHGAGSCPVGRVPAGEIETAAMDQLRAVFRQPEIVAGTTL